MTKFVVASEPASNRDRTITRNDIYTATEHAAVRPRRMSLETGSRSMATTFCKINAAWVCHPYGREPKKFDPDSPWACPKCVKVLRKAEADGIDLSKPKLTPTENKLWQELRGLKEKTVLRRMSRGLFSLDAWGFKIGPFRWATYQGLEEKGYIKTEPGPYGSPAIMPIPEEEST